MTDLPSGTITFLFTDIEGSTAHWEEQKAAMQTALARHDAILRQAIERNHGSVFKTVGDAFYAAFPSAHHGLAAALDAQRALGAEPWPEGCAIKVRMALHTGEADERDRDYFGPTLNRLSRLLSTGHGGQILTSSATEALLRDELGAEVGLRDLGEHRLKDLTRPERVYQVVAADLPAEFPALKTLDRRPNNLPMQPTPFIGRERELHDLVALLERPEVRLITLTGAAGTGKTRLALQAAAERSDEYADGIFFVPLVAVSEASLVASTIAHTMGVKEGGGRSLSDTLADHLRSAQVLLLLDNFEHLLAAAPLLGALLASSARLVICVTSQAVLHLAAEHAFPVGPFAVPDTTRLPPLEALAQLESVRLFAERARAVKPDFVLDAHNAPAVAEICHRLDGLPLAIELAAARIRLFPPQALLRRLDTRLQLLTGGARDAPSRQQTLRGAIDWSYSMLEAGDQKLFARLSVFAGGSTLEAIEDVCLPNDDLDLLDSLASLVDKSLVRQAETAGGEPRFGMLQILEEYAAERLQAEGRADDWRVRHADHYLRFAEEAAPALLGPDAGLWLDRLDLEHDNLRAALRWTIDHDDGERSLRLSVALWRFWYARGFLAEGRRWLAVALSLGGHVNPALRADALNGAGNLAWEQADYDRSVALHNESLALGRELGDKSRIARSLNNLAAVAQHRENLAEAARLYEEALGIQRATGDKMGTAVVLSNLGDVALQQGDYGRAMSLSEESLGLWRALGDVLNIARVLTTMGNIAVETKEYGRAAAFQQESIALSERLGQRENLPWGLEGLARLAGAQGQGERAARLFGAANALREDLERPLSPTERADHERYLSTVRTSLGAQAFDAAWTAGGTTPLEQVVADAMQALSQSPQPS